MAPAKADPIPTAFSPLPRTNWGTIIGLMLGLLLIATLIVLAIFSI